MRLDCIGPAAGFKCPEANYRFSKNKFPWRCDSCLDEWDYRERGGLGRVWKNGKWVKKPRDPRIPLDLEEREAFFDRNTLEWAYLDGELIRIGFNGMPLFKRYWPRWEKANKNPEVVAAEKRVKELQKKLREATKEERAKKKEERDQKKIAKESAERKRKAEIKRIMDSYGKPKGK